MISVQNGNMEMSKLLSDNGALPSFTTSNDENILLHCKAAELEIN
jgi:hypothetical protein